MKVTGVEYMNNGAVGKGLLYSQDEVKSLLKGAKEILRHQDFNTAARLIFDTCKDLIGARSGYIALLSSDGKENEVLFLDAGGMPCSVDSSLPMPIRGLREQAYRYGKPVYNNDFNNSQWVKYMPKGHVQLENVLFAPLIIENKVVGLLGIANKPGGFNDHDTDLASTFGEYAAIALNNSRNLDKLEHARKDLKLINESLEEKIEERTQEVQNLLNQKNDFIIQVGHDLKTPLSPLLMLLPVLEKRNHDSEDQKIIQIINKKIHILNNTVERIIHLAKLNSNSMVLLKENMNLCDEINNVKDAIKKLLESKNIQVTNTISDELIIKGDKSLIKELISNLLINAISFIEHNGNICIESMIESNEITIRIKDDGIGLSEDQQECIFNEFYKADSSRHEVQNIGLGLAICKRIVELHDGKIGVESEGIGKGCTVCFTLKM